MFQVSLPALGYIIAALFSPVHGTGDLHAAHRGLSICSEDKRTTVLLPRLPSFPHQSSSSVSSVGQYICFLFPYLGFLACLIDPYSPASPSIQHTWLSSLIAAGPSRPPVDGLHTYFWAFRHLVVVELVLSLHSLPIIQYSGRSRPG